MRTWFFLDAPSEGVRGSCFLHWHRETSLWALSLDPVVGSEMLHRELLQDGDVPVPADAWFQDKVSVHRLHRRFPSNKFTFYN